MPIFQDDLDHEERPPLLLREPPRSALPLPLPLVPVDAMMATTTRNTPSLARKVSEESIRTDLCEGPVPDSPNVVMAAPGANDDIDEQQNAVTSDRAELIERLKRGESPTWIPNRHLESIFHQHGPTPTPKSPRSGTNSPSLLPPADITTGRAAAAATAEDDEDAEERRLREGLDIERPRSALHSGDFTPESASQDGSQLLLATQPDTRGSHALDHHRREAEAFPAAAVAAASRPQSWLATSPPRDFSPLQFERRTSFSTRAAESRSALSSLSSSLSSSFVYKPPTSPLVQSQVNEDDTAAAVAAAVDDHLSIPLDGIAITSGSPASGITAAGTSTRRHTLYAAVASSPFAFPPPSRGPTPNRQPLHRREGSLPYQAHQPRRSLTSTPNNIPSLTLATSPQTPPFLRSRRPSFSSDASPLQASMVGSYEESILRGRMSTNPSRPLDFLAQIGVLGLGRCKSSLRCPPHVTLPFPAVFYSYGGGNGSASRRGGAAMEDGPSPYVGQIDLENGLPNPEEGARARRKMHSRYGGADRRPANDEDEPEADVDLDLDVNMTEAGAATTGGEASDLEVRRAPARSKRRSGSGSPKAPPGGSYRIPEKGQIQIVIKNQNKTAVKLFLVPYDLAGMEPGTKTFIRQRSYSAGPIIDTVPGAGLGADPLGLGSQDRPILRYLVHLHICCPSKGRFYLYKSIRLVFANRVPDGKEKLRNETTWPEPRWSPYRPIRVMHPPTMGGAVGGSTGGGGMALAAEKAFRRRSSGWSFSAQHFDLDGAVQPLPPPQLPVQWATVQSTQSTPSSLSRSLSLTHSQQRSGASIVAARPSSTVITTTTTMRATAAATATAGFGGGSGGDHRLVDPIPLRLPSRNRTGTQTSDGTDTSASASAMETSGFLRSPGPEADRRAARTPSPALGASPSASAAGVAIGTTTTPPSASSAAATYEKLSRGDVGYGGNAFVPAAPAGSPGAEGLLSQRLRSLGVQGGAGLGEPRAEDDVDGML